MLPIFIIFLLVAFFQVVYSLLVFSRLAAYDGGEAGNEKQSLPSISMIICARNEFENLKNNLLSVLQQQYSGEWEIIVVDDASTDNTRRVLEEYAERFSQLKLVKLKNKDAKILGKKAALKAGIEAAQYDYVLLTDADCSPASDQWAAIMASKISATVEIVLGYGPYIERNGWLNKCVQYETLLTAAQYFSWSLLGKAYMGVGRNMLAKKSLYKNHPIFSVYSNLSSGDDDLFMKSASSITNTAICIDPQSFCFSKAPTDYKAWYRQKKRHLSTASSYTFFHQLVLGLFSLTHFLIYLLGIVLLIRGIFPQMVLLVFLIKWAAQIYYFNKIAKRLEVRWSWWELWAFDFLYLGFYVIFTQSLLGNNSTGWENRN